MCSRTHSLSLIRQLDTLSFSPEKKVLLTLTDVAVLYPSINIEDGMKALQWFMAEHPSTPQNLQPKHLRLARFVLELCRMQGCRGLVSAEDRHSNVHVLFGYVCYHFHDLAGNTHYQ
jgi:hypothetical protein